MSPGFVPHPVDGDAAAAERRPENGGELLRVVGREKHRELLGGHRDRLTVQARRYRSDQVVALRAGRHQYGREPQGVEHLADAFRCSANCRQGSFRSPPIGEIREVLRLGSGRGDVPPRRSDERPAGFGIASPSSLTTSRGGESGKAHRFFANTSTRRAGRGERARMRRLSPSRSRPAGANCQGRTVVRSRTLERAPRTPTAKPRASRSQRSPRWSRLLAADESPQRWRYACFEHHGDPNDLAPPAEDVRR